MSNAIRWLLQQPGQYPKSAAALTTVASAITAVASWTNFPPRLIASAMAVVGLAYFGRVLTHLMYYVGKRAGDKTTPRLRRLVIGEMVTSVGWLAGIALVLNEDSAGLMFAFCFVFFVMVALLASEVGKERRDAGLKSATAYVRKTRLAGKLMDALDSIGAEGLSRFLFIDRSRSTFDAIDQSIVGIKMPPPKVSLTVAAILMVLAVAAGTSAPLTLDEAKNTLAGFDGGDTKTNTTTTSTTETTEGTASTSEQPAPKPNPEPIDPPITEPSPPPRPLTGDPTPETPKTYEDLCGAEPTGSPAPQPQASALRSVFLFPGQPASGCAADPFMVSKVSNSWVMAGYCDGHLWSLAVADSDGHAGLLMGSQAAKLGFDLARHRELIGASDRISISSGDAYVIRTVSGTRVLIRSQTSTGTTKDRIYACSQVPTNAVDYVDLPPELASMWLALSQDEFSWPRKREMPGPGQSFEFVTSDAPARKLAMATCLDGKCTMTGAAGVRLSSTQDVTASAIRDLG